MPIVQYGHVRVAQRSELAKDTGLANFAVSGLPLELGGLDVSTHPLKCRIIRVY